MKTRLQILVNRLHLFLKPEPVVKTEYIDKVVYLLRRDFPIKEQNEIIIAIVNKLHALRDKDMREAEEAYKELQDHAQALKSRFATT